MKEISDKLILHVTQKKKFKCICETNSKLEIRLKILIYFPIFNQFCPPIILYIYSHNFSYEHCNSLSALTHFKCCKLSSSSCQSATGKRSSFMRRYIRIVISMAQANSKMISSKNSCHLLRSVSTKFFQSRSRILEPKVTEDGRLLGFAFIVPDASGILCEI